MEITFTRNSGSGERKKITAPAGSHVGKLLEVTAKMQKKPWDDTDKYYVVFVWDVEIQEGEHEGETTRIWRDVNPVVNEKSNLVKDFCALTGIGVDETLKLSDDKIIEHLQGVVGSRYMVNVTHSKNGYHKIASVSKLPKQLQTLEEATKQEQARNLARFEGLDIDTDDIPF